ncbi:hypothetical protein D9M68_879660 [compost metagenome]
MHGTGFAGVRGQARACRLDCLLTLHHLRRPRQGQVCLLSSQALRVISHTSTRICPATKCPSRVATLRMPSYSETLREAWLATALGTCMTGRDNVSNQYALMT